MVVHSLSLTLSHARLMPKKDIYYSQRLERLAPPGGLRFGKNLDSRKKTLVNACGSRVFATWLAVLNSRRVRRQAMMNGRLADSQPLSNFPRPPRAIAFADNARHVIDPRHHLQSNKESADWTGGDAGCLGHSPRRSSARTPADAVREERGCHADMQMSRPDCWHGLRKSPRLVRIGLRRILAA